MQFDGLLLIDKPAGLTSHDVVGRLRRALKQKTVGHTGTLDPLATGLMVMVLGEATKLSDYLTAEDKEYRVDVRLGVTTDSLDRTGRVLSETNCDLPEPLIRNEVEKLQGDFEWPVPLFSAAKIDGKKLFEYGRKGQDVELPVKTMSFWGARVLEVRPSGVQLTLACSKGSFIRTWAAQLGANLTVGGIVDELRRLRVGSWSLADALTLEQLEEACAASGMPALGKAFIPMAAALPRLKSILAPVREARLVGHGQIPRDLASRLVYEQKQAHESGQPVFVKVLNSAGELLAIVAAEPRQGLKIRRVFRQFA